MPEQKPMSTNDRLRVVIIGAGFGGMAVAKGLAGAEVDLTVLDRPTANVCNILQP